MHLCDRGRRDRLAERDEQALKRPAEGLLDRRDGDGATEGRHAVLQCFELAHHLRADDVRPRREELSELHVGRPEPRHGGGDAARAGSGAAPRDELGDREQRPRGDGGERRVDLREHPFARHDEADVREPRDVNQRAEHGYSFQPEWIATTPPVIRVKAERRKPASAIMSRKRSAGGNFRIDSTR